MNICNLCGCIHCESSTIGLHPLRVGLWLKASRYRRLETDVKNELGGQSSMCWRQWRKDVHERKDSNEGYTNKNHTLTPRRNFLNHYLKYNKGEINTAGRARRQHIFQIKKGLQCNTCAELEIHRVK